MKRDKWGQPLPQIGGTFGGNNIPEAYLDRFNARTDAWLKRIGARRETPVEVVPADMPAKLAGFVRMEL